MEVFGFFQILLEQLSFRLFFSSVLLFRSTYIYCRNYLNNILALCVYMRGPNVVYSTVESSFSQFVLILFFLLPFFLL